MRDHGSAPVVAMERLTPATRLTPALGLVHTSADQTHAEQVPVTGPVQVPCEHFADAGHQPQSRVLVQLLQSWLALQLSAMDGGGAEHFELLQTQL